MVSKRIVTAPAKMSALPEFDPNLFRQLVDNIADNIYFMDRQGRIIYINPAGARWLGYDSPDEVIGKTDLDLFTEEHGREACEDEARIMRSGQPVINKEEKETRPDGRITWVSTTKIPLRDRHGQVIGVCGISRDITEMKTNQLKVEAISHRMAMELQLARDVQRSFLPPARFTFPEEATSGAARLDFVCHYQPSGEVGGDYFTWLPQSATETGVLIADVIGHGVDAALLMSALNALVHDESAPVHDPGAFLSFLDQRMKKLFSAVDTFEFITAFYLVINISDGTCRHASAGHHSPLVIRQQTGDVQPLFDHVHQNGPALMLAPNAVFSVQAGALAPGDLLLLFTDGLFEVQLSATGEDLGEEGLIDIVNEQTNLPVDQLADAVIQRARSLSGGRFKDDVCLVAMQFLTVHREPDK